MISTSQTYKSLLNDELASGEWRITIGSTVYGQDKIYVGSGAPALTRMLFNGNGEAIPGESNASMFTCTMLTDSSNIPRMATVVPEFRLTKGSTVSEWLPMGTFFIDVRTPDKESGTVQLECYDAMLKGCSKPYKDLTAFTTWPQGMSAVVSEIANLMGITVDSRSSINSGAGYQVEYPNDLTPNEILKYIAAAHGGCFTITAQNKLRLVLITGNLDSTNIGWKITALKNPQALPAWTGATIYWDDENAFDAGNETGRVMTVDCPWATQATASGLLSVIQTHQYVPYTAEGSIIDLAIELGDQVIIGGNTSRWTGTTTSYVFNMDITCLGKGRAKISAPGEAEVDHEYPYDTATDRALRRRVQLSKPYYGVTISREAGIEIKRTDGKSEAIFNSDVFAMRALIDGSMQDRIYFDPIKGDYVFAGSLAADAVFTESLYAEQGDIAELTVDQLSTSRRIRKYNNQDTSDDNYIFIHEQTIQFITGTVSEGTRQATNRFGAGLYWAREPVTYNDGYPYDEDGAQIYATTTQTEWPIMVYNYTEQVKAQFTFEQLENIYRPVLTLGAGDQNGNDKTTLVKEAGEFNMLYKTDAGNDIGMRCTLAGYTDLYGLRRATNIDFSNWDNGSFSATLDGGLTATYSVAFDLDGHPVSITDGADGHVCTIVWPVEEEEEG